VLSGRGLCDELITRPEESHRLWCVVLCDLETTKILGKKEKKKNKKRKKKKKKKKMGHQWSDSDSEKPSIRGETCPSYFVHHKFHMDWSGIEVRS
jgi:hypothetical protein